MIKRVLLSLFVLATFAIYSFQQRNDSSSSVVATTSSTESTKTTQNATQSAATPAPAATTTQPATSTPAIAAKFRDGQYTGTSVDAFYGFVQVKAIISGGKLVSIEYLETPTEHHNSVEINARAMPILQKEAIAAQSADVDIVSGATESSQAFRQSLSVALNSART